MQTFSKPHSAAALFFIFIAVWVVLNGVQAASIGVDADEAYYWLYARHLQWGYFDHPPLVALSIKLGEALGHGAFYTRLGTVLLSAGTAYFGFKLLPQPLQHVQLYVLSFASVVLFHVYGFIATPDAALLFFTTLFFYAYKKFLDQETVAHVLLLSFSIAGLLYSKYHGVLPLFFTFLSYPKLALKPSAWAVVALVLLLFSPHLWWQYGHNWPTFRYHLSERIASNYRLQKTTDYIAGQLFIWGPVSTIPAFIFFVKQKLRYSTYERAHLFTVCGVFLFFLLSSLRSTIEPHWTLVAGPSFLVLLQRMLYTASVKTKRTFRVLLCINVGLILLLRFLFLLPQSPLKKVQAFDAFFYAKSWTASMQKRAAGRPVVFVDSYKFPALYTYYLKDAQTWDYNTVNYRKTQFSLYNDAFLNNKAVLLASKYPLSKNDNFFKTPYVDLYVQPLDSFKAVSNLQIAWNTAETHFKKGQLVDAVVTLRHTGTDTIATANLFINYTFVKTRAEQVTSPFQRPFVEKKVPPGFTKQLQLPLQVPKTAGRYRLVFSIVQPPLAGSFASPLYSVAVE